MENTLSWGYDPRRSEYVFPLHNLRYEPQQTGVEAKHEKPSEPEVTFLPQDRKTTEYSTFSETGKLAVEIHRRDLYEIDDALKLMRLFLREKDETIGRAWPKKRLRDFVVSRLQAAGYEETFLSKANFLRLQEGFRPLLGGQDTEHPRMSQIAAGIVPVDMKEMPHQSFSESMLKEHGFFWIAKEDAAPFGGHETHLWEQYQRYRKHFVECGDDVADHVKAIASRIKEIDPARFKLPWNILYASHEPEREFSELLFAHADLFDAFVKMPNVGGYALPYSYTPAKAAKMHGANETFHPDFFIKVRDAHDILVVEVKAEGDDSNRNGAKCRDGLEHFRTLNERLKEAGEPWHYDFYFLSPEDYTHFFGQVTKSHRGWRSGLMQELAG